MLLLIGLSALGIGLSLGVLGGGGSILAVPALVYLGHYEPRAAVAASLIIVGLSALVGALSRRQLVDRNAVLSFSLWGMGATYLGARLAAFLSDAQQLGIFAVVMVAIAVLMLRGGALPRPGQRRSSVLPALGVGLLTGLVGVGGGFLIVPALVLAAGLDMRRAVPTSLAIIFLNCLAGLLGTLDEVQLDPRFLAVFTALVMTGLTAGARVSTRLPHAALKRGFAFMLLIVGGWMLVHNL